MVASSQGNGVLNFVCAELHGHLLCVSSSDCSLTICCNPNCHMSPTQKFSNFAFCLCCDSDSRISLSELKPSKQPLSKDPWQWGCSTRLQWQSPNEERSNLSSIACVAFLYYYRLKNNYRFLPLVSGDRTGVLLTFVKVPLSSPFAYLCMSSVCCLLGVETLKLFTLVPACRKPTRLPLEFDFDFLSQSLSWLITISSLNWVRVLPPPVLRLVCLDWMTVWVAAKALVSSLVLWSSDCTVFLTASSNMTWFWTVSLFGGDVELPWPLSFCFYSLMWGRVPPPPWCLFLGLVPKSM